MSKKFYTYNSPLEILKTGRVMTKSNQYIGGRLYSNIIRSEPVSYELFEKALNHANQQYTINDLYSAIFKGIVALEQKTDLLTMVNNLYDEKKQTETLNKKAFLVNLVKSSPRLLSTILSTPRFKKELQLKDTIPDLLAELQVPGAQADLAKIKKLTSDIYTDNNLPDTGLHKRIVITLVAYLCDTHFSKKTLTKQCERLEDVKTLLSHCSQTKDERCLANAMFITLSTLKTGVLGHSVLRDQLKSQLKSDKPLQKTDVAINQESINTMKSLLSQLQFAITNQKQTGIINALVLIEFSGLLNKSITEKLKALMPADEQQTLDNALRGKRLLVDTLFHKHFLPKEVQAQALDLLRLENSAMVAG